MLGAQAATCVPTASMKIERSVLVPFSPLEMYQLVLDVPSYPEFLTWCSKATVHEQTDEMQLASLGVSVGGMYQRFTTRNRLQKGELLTLSLVDGPFRKLSGEWRFAELGTEGCKVSLHLSFEFSNVLLSAAFRRGFEKVSERMVGDFGRRATNIYG